MPRYTDEQTEAIAGRVAKLAADNPRTVYVPPTGEFCGDNSGRPCCYHTGRLFDNETGQETGAGGCIVGQAIASLGYEMPAIWQGNSGIASFVEDAHGSRHAEFLGNVQRQQDKGKPWADAIRGAVFLMGGNYSPQPA